MGTRASDFYDLKLISKKEFNNIIKSEKYLYLGFILILGFSYITKYLSSK